MEELMFKNLMIITLLVMVLCPLLNAEHSQLLVGVPCEIEITQLVAGIIQDAPGGAPKWMHTDWRLKEIAFKVKRVSPQSEWELYQYGDDNPTASKEVYQKISKILAKKKPHVFDMYDKINYIAEVYKLLKKHRIKFSSNVKGPFIAHIIYMFSEGKKGWDHNVSSQNISVDLAEKRVLQ